MFRQAWDLSSQRVSKGHRHRGSSSEYQEARAHDRMERSMRTWRCWGRRGTEGSALGGGDCRATSEGSHQLLFLYCQGGGSALESNQQFLQEASLLAEPSLELKPPPLSFRAFARGTRSSPPAGQLRVEAGQAGASLTWLDCPSQGAARVSANPYKRPVRVGFGPPFPY